jgi:hypothetical protein
MHRHVVPHGHQLTLIVKEGTGVVSALLDVGRVSCSPQNSTHLLGNGGKEISINLKFDGMI